MKIKVIMDSGKEYFSEKDSTVEELLTRGLGEAKIFSVNYITLDNAEKIFINVSHISSIEVINENAITYDESDPIVY